MKLTNRKVVGDAHLSDDKLYILNQKTVKGKVKRGPGKGQRYQTGLWYFSLVEDEVIPW
jgi:hypothetical protein